MSMPKSPYQSSAIEKAKELTIHKTQMVIDHQKSGDGYKKHS